MTDDANDVREGYADGQANNYQHKRGPIYDHAWWEGACDAIRLMPPRVQPSLWARFKAYVASFFA